MVRNLHTMNELFNFLKKKFDENEIESIISLFRDYIDDLGLSSDEVYLDVENKSTELDVAIVIAIRDEDDRKIIMSSDSISNFFTSISIHYKIIKGVDYYRGFFDHGRTDFYLDLLRKVDENIGCYKFKITRK